MLHHDLRPQANGGVKNAVPRVRQDFFRYCARLEVRQHLVLEFETPCAVVDWAPEMRKLFGRCCGRCEQLLLEGVFVRRKLFGSHVLDCLRHSASVHEFDCPFRVVRSQLVALHDATHVVYVAEGGNASIHDVAELSLCPQFRVRDRGQEGRQDTEDHAMFDGAHSDEKTHNSDVVPITWPLVEPPQLDRRLRSHDWHNVADLFARLERLAVSGPPLCAVLDLIEGSSRFRHVEVAHCKTSELHRLRQEELPDRRGHGSGCHAAKSRKLLLPGGMPR
mmetsp:Transcript_44811/g.124198  ORF Transcript_44811/g.124198 Transcript_44811/m.124198 type:complete len:277 (-) Transcript_44811:2447-3277(-)